MFRDGIIKGFRSDQIRLCVKHSRSTHSFCKSVNLAKHAIPVRNCMSTTIPPCAPMRKFSSNITLLTAHCTRKSLWIANAKIGSSHSSINGRLIRQEPTLEGIYIAGSHNCQSKMSQYADDTTLTFANKYSIWESFTILKRFQPPRHTREQKCTIM